jgi:cytohesin
MRCLLLPILALVVICAGCIRSPYSSIYCDPGGRRLAERTARQLRHTQGFLRDAANAGGIDAPEEYGRTRLMNAAASDETAPDVVRLLLDAGADVNAADADARTPLMLAATADWRHQHGCMRPHEHAVEVVRVLAERGADLEATDIEGRTALSLCAAAGDAERVNVIADAGADLDASDADGLTPLMWAARRGNTLALHAMIDRGADVRARDQGGRTALMWLSRGSIYQDTTLNALLDAGADLEARDDAGWTPVMHAAYYASTNSLVQALLAAGAKAEPAGWSELTQALLRQDREEFERSLSEGADVNARDAWGRTPLMWSASFLWCIWDESTRGCEEWYPMQQLLDAGAVVDARDDEGSTASHLAAEHTLWGIQPLIFAGADLEARDDKGRTPLHWAAANHYANDNVQFLLDAGADPDTRDDDGRTPLIVAAKSRLSQGNVELLLRGGADPNAADARGRTALMEAARNPSGLDLIEPLVAAGADSDLVDQNGQTAEDLARLELGDWYERAYRNRVTSGLRERDRLLERPSRR